MKPPESAARFAAALRRDFPKNPRAKTAQIHSIYYITFPLELSRGLRMFLKKFPRRGIFFAASARGGAVSTCGRLEFLDLQSAFCARIFRFGFEFRFMIRNGRLLLTVVLVSPMRNTSSLL